MQDRLLKPSALGLAALAAVAVASAANAVVRVDSAMGNEGAPVDATLAAWNLQGNYNQFLGTPIAPNLFIVAQHVSVPGAGRTLIYNQGMPGEVTYTSTGSYDIAGTDLRVFQIDPNVGPGAFANYATLYSGASGSEAGKQMFVVGRGLDRGAAYQPDGVLHGWLWGANRQVKTWGRDVVDATPTDDDYGGLISFEFAQPDGIGLTGGDSSGGLFVFNDGQWQLAGINLGVDGRWNDEPTGGFDDASIFDATGLYIGTSGNAQLADFVAASSYASSLSANRAAINSIFLATGNAALVPEPTTLATLGATMLLARRRRVV